MAKKISIKLSGVGLNDLNNGRMSCDFIHLSTDIEESEIVDKIGYTDLIFDEKSYKNEIKYINYTDDTGGQYFLSQKYNGIYFGKSAGDCDIFKREKNDDIEFPWEPVLINSSATKFSDFNIESGKSYEYLLVPNNSQINPSVVSNIHPCFNYWILAELIPEKAPLNTPAVKKVYKVDTDSIWKFKFSLDTGSQTQNITKNEIRTLGQFPKIGYSNNNYISGSVSCLLGSEIDYYSKDRYIERMDKNKILSTNEKVLMLNKWRKIAFSKNPKILKDMKGQVWIVQIMSSSNTPKNFYRNIPDTISFEWRQIDNTDNAIIYGIGEL